MICCWVNSPQYDTAKLLVSKALRDEKEAHHRANVRRVRQASPTTYCQIPLLKDRDHRGCGHNDCKRLGVYARVRSERGTK